jgi:hypothetical protein
LPGNSLLNYRAHCTAIAGRFVFGGTLPKAAPHCAKYVRIEGLIVSNPFRRRKAPLFDMVRSNLAYTVSRGFPQELV